MVTVIHIFSGDNIMAGANAVANKIKDSDKDLGTEYYKKKLKEKVDYGFPVF